MAREPARPLTKNIKDPEVARAIDELYLLVSSAKIFEDDVTKKRYRLVVRDGALELEDV